jgi:hypothetical protein
MSFASRMALAMAIAMVGCTSVRMVERDGCWVKRTERTLGGNSEELGFCTRQPAPPADDRLARLVQECMAQADHRWENQALAAWNRNQAIPTQADDGEVVKTCMTQVSTVLGLEAENSALKARLAELGQDREALRTATDRDRAFLQQNSDKMVSALGDAAKKPAPAATATATVKSETDLKSLSPQAPPATVVGFAAPAAAPVVVTPVATPVVVTPSLPPSIQTPATLPVVRPSSAICPARKTTGKKLPADETQKDLTCIPAAG